MYGVLKDTPLLEIIRTQEVASAKGVVHPAFRFQEALLRDGRGLALIGVSVSLVIFLWACFRPQRRLVGVSVGAAIIALVITLPVLGAFDLFGYNVSQWFVTNQRYALHWYPLLAVALLAPLAGPAQVGPVQQWLRQAKAVFLILLCGVTYHYTLRHWYRNHWDIGYIKNRLQIVNTAQHMLGERRLILEDAQWNYYLGDRHVVMYSTATQPVFQAHNDVQVEQALEALHAGGVLLRTSSLAPWWSHSALFEYLQNAGCRIDIPEYNQTLYLVPKLAPEASCQAPNQ